MNRTNFSGSIDAPFKTNTSLSIPMYFIYFCFDSCVDGVDYEGDKHGTEVM